MRVNKGFIAGYSSSLAGEAVGQFRSAVLMEVHMHETKQNQQTLEGTRRKEEKERRNGWRLIKALITLGRIILKLLEYFSSE